MVQLSLFRNMKIPITRQILLHVQSLGFYEVRKSNVRISNVRISNVRKSNVRKSNVRKSNVRIRSRNLVGEKYLLFVERLLNPSLILHMKRITHQKESRIVLSWTVSQRRRYGLWSYATPIASTVGWIRRFMARYSFSTRNSIHYTCLSSDGNEEQGHCIDTMRKPMWSHGRLRESPWKHFFKSCFICIISKLLRSRKIY